MADIFKLRNLGDAELEREQRQASEQLFRLRFQMKLGQNEGAKKMRDLRRDIARIKTIRRERELGLERAGTMAKRKPGARLSDRPVEAAVEPAKPEQAAAAPDAAATSEAGNQ